MSTYLNLKNRQIRPLPESLHADDVRYPDELVTHFVQEFSQAGDVVFDPFAGFGTTLIVAEQMGRVGYGVEWDSTKVDYIRSQIAQKSNIVQGDARHLLRYELPQFELCMTSPPYTHRGEEDNALTNYQESHSGYEQYLAEMRGVYRKVAQLGKQVQRLSSRLRISSMGQT